MAAVIRRFLALAILMLGAIALHAQSQFPANKIMGCGGAACDPNVVGLTLGPTFTITGSYPNYTINVTGLGNSLAYSVFGNGTGTSGTSGWLTTLPCSLATLFTGDGNNSINGCLWTNTGASGPFTVQGILSENTLNPPTVTFAPPEIDYSNIGTSGIVSVTAVAGSVTTGTYTSVAATGGSGSGAVGTVISVGGIATSILITTPGTGYLIGDSPLSFNTGSGTATATVFSLNDPETHWIGSGGTVNYNSWGCNEWTTAAPTRNYGCYAASDTFGTRRYYFSVTGTGTFSGAFVLTEEDFGESGDNPNYVFKGTGSITNGGSITSGTTLAPGTYNVHGTTTICEQYPNTNSGAITTEVNLAYCPIPAGWMGTLGVLKVTVTWNNANTSQAKTAVIRFTSSIPTVGSAWSTGAIVMNQAMTASNPAAQSLTIIRNAGAANAQVALQNSFTPFTAGGNVYTPSQNTAIGQYIAIDCTDAASNGSTEMCGVGGVMVELTVP
jgi:hypothetical protein